MLKLYYSPGACSFVPHVALEIIKEKTSAEFETQNVRLHKGEQATPEYLAINPNGQVPVLMIDGKPLTQIVAILSYLDAVYPSAKLLPTEPLQRAHSLAALAWMNNTVHPTFTHIFMPHKYTPDVAAQAALKTHNTEIFRGHLERIQTKITELGSLTNAPYLSGETAGVFDAYALTFLRWGSMAGINPESLPVYAAHVAKVAQNQAFATVIEREKLKLNMFKE